MNHHCRITAESSEDGTEAVFEIDCDICGITTVEVPTAHLPMLHAILTAILKAKGIGDTSGSLKEILQ